MRVVYAIRLIRCLALLHSFGGCHQCRSNPANLLPYGLGYGWSCFEVLRWYYNYEVGQCESGHLFYLGLLRLEGGHWVAYYVC